MLENKIKLNCFKVQNPKSVEAIYIEEMFRHYCQFLVSSIVIVGFFFVINKYKKTKDNN